MTNDVVVRVYLSEFREKVFRALPPAPYQISLHKLTIKVYGGYDAKNDKGRRSHVMKALYDLWKMKLAYHEAIRRGGRWTGTKYSRTSKRVIIERKPR